MAKSYLPERDADVAAWVTNFTTYAAANAAALGLTTTQVEAVESLGNDFDTALAAHNAAQVAAKTAREVKDAGRTALYASIRALVKVIQAHPGVTDAQRQALGITVPKTNKTPVPPPTDRPDPDVHEIDELTHTLRIVNSDTNKATKPEGVSGVEVWMKLVPAGDPAPVNPDELEFAGFTTTSKFVRDFDGTDAGKTAFYRTRYLSTRGEHGPWGNQVGATVAA
jgi:hypothetical protein